MNELLSYIIATIKNFGNGLLGNFPDPATPGDLGSPLTQPEIDFVKQLKAEFERYSTTPTCTDEKTGVSITDATATSFTLAWTNPVGYLSTAVTYRVTGTTTWISPNSGDKNGHFNSTYDAFIFTDMTVGVSYDLRVQNECPSSIVSAGVIKTATAI